MRSVATASPMDALLVFTILRLSYLQKEAFYFILGLFKARIFDFNRHPVWSPEMDLLHDMLKPSRNCSLNGYR